jgi:hypothetical protein
MPAGEQDVFQIVLHVNANTPDLTTITNSADINSTTTPDQDTTNNHAALMTLISAVTDVGVDKTIRGGSPPSRPARWSRTT